MHNNDKKKKKPAGFLLVGIKVIIMKRMPLYVRNGHLQVSKPDNCILP